MRTIVVGDIHGCYNELKQLIKKLEDGDVYRKYEDKLVFLGDYIDRGEDSRLVIEYIRNLQQDNDNVIALMGNHEDMLLDYHYGLDNSWLYNGCSDTRKSYKGFKEQFNNDIKWMENLPLYYEDDYFIYVHAGIDMSKSIEEQDRNTLLWVREPFIDNATKYHKQVIFGHTPTINLIGNYKPVYTYGDNIDIDTACVYGGALTALVIDDDKVSGFYQINKSYKEKNVQ